MDRAFARHSYSLLETHIDELSRHKKGHSREPEFRRWHAQVELIIRRAFGAESYEHVAFKRIDFEPPGQVGGYAKIEAFQSGLEEVRLYLETIMSQLVWFHGAGDGIGDPEDEGCRTASHGDRLARILDRFHAVAIALSLRNRKERAPVSIADEYDVQYVLRALLAVEFPDVRPEEYTPSHAGASSRVDFFLKQERTIVEAKMTRTGLADRRIGDELSVDIERYRKHPDCGALYCFVYDPEHRIQNPIGLEQDLSRDDPFPVRVFVRPKR